MGNWSHLITKELYERQIVNQKCIVADYWIHAPLLESRPINRCSCHRSWIERKGEREKVIVFANRFNSIMYSGKAE